MNKRKISANIEIKKEVLDKIKEINRLLEELKNELPEGFNLTFTKDNENTKGLKIDKEEI